MKKTSHLLNCFIILAMFVSSCEKTETLNMDESDIERSEFIHEIQLTEIGCLTDNVIIGKKLDNPYSIRNMRKACDDLFPATKGEVPLSDSLIEPNFLYVRFLPSDSTEVNTLLESNLELFNYPLDYEILGDPSDYYDSSIDEGKITWQYTAVPIEQEMPLVRHEILDICYIPAENYSSSDSRIIREIEDRAFDNTGNTGAGSGGSSSGGSGSSSSSTNKLKGKIRVLDTSLGYQGVKGIKVRARVFLKIRTGYTDEDGNYSISNDFTLTPRYELRFENKYGFKEGYSLGCLVLPATRDMKKSKNLDISRSDSQKWWSLATINNAAYDWFKFCENNNITKPANNLRIWALKIGSGASTLMLHHGLFNYTNVSNAVSFIALKSSNPYVIIADVALKALIQLVGPDITICDIDSITDSREIYENICHEMAHATHFQKLGSTDIGRCLWWSRVFDYELAYISSPGYGAESYIGSGPCGVTEMWAYAMGYYLQNKSYSLSRKTFPRSHMAYWFKPDALWDLLISGDITPKQASDCLIPAVTTVSDFKDKLISNNPTKQTIIENTYAKY